MEKASRILLFFLVLLASSDHLYSNSDQDFSYTIETNEYVVYEENGKVGLKDQQGKVLIPAQYEALGWSNGKLSLINNVTGYRNGNLWGLINLQNSRITKSEFVDLSPGEGDLIVARKKIKGTIRIQTGCINSSGKVIIPFQYDGLRISAFRCIVYTRTTSQFKHGLINFDNKILIPLNYQSVYPLGSLRYGVQDFNSKTAIFSEDGEQITNFVIDSISTFKKDYAVIYQNQLQGLIDRQGRTKLEPIYREIKIQDDGSVSARKADGWFWLNGENKLIRQINADSVSVVQPNLLKIKTGEKIWLADKDFKPVNDLLFSFVGQFKNGKTFFRIGARTGMLNNAGKIIIKPLYKELLPDRQFIRARLNDEQAKWIVLDSVGHTITSRGYEYLDSYNGKYFPAKNRGYWGVINDQGKEIVACVHDSLIQQQNDLIVVKFKGKYGVINLKEDWIVTPQVGKLRLLNDDRYLQSTPKTKFLKSRNGQIIYFSDNALEVKDSYLLEYLPSGIIWKIDLNGVIVDRMVHPQDIERIFEEREGLRAIKKDGRYGFVDSRGRLRIANRYEDVKDFSNSLAAAKIRGKWGFINKEDQIAIQPVYDEVLSFKEKFAIVKQKSFCGLIDKTGKLVLPVRYDSIVVLPEHRFKVKQNNMWGLADGRGKIILNPKYDELNDLNNGYIIVSREGKFGLLSLQGISTIPQIYDGLKFDPYHNEYIALKKTAWEELRLTQ